MDVVMDGNQNAQGVTTSWCDIEEIMHRTAHTASRPAMICSLRILRDKGLLQIKSRGEIRRGRRRTIYLPTNFAFDELITDLGISDELEALEKNLAGKSRR